MGQCISVPHRKISLMREGSTRCFYKSKPGNLSATFHVLDSSLRWDLLNVNIATEEQLMTLPGINRTIAENIIEYRQKIGGFKKVEDLALVSGVGATKLEQFRTEVSVGRRKGNGSSYNSSLTQSMESLQTNEGSSRSSPLKLINVNTANVFQLMSISRMTQEMAANIVHYRDRKGPFKNVEELLKVKGLPPDRLAIVKMYLTVDPCLDQNNSSSVNNKINTNNLYVKPPISHRRTSSAPCGFGKSRSADLSTKDLYDLISPQVIRPVLQEDFKFLRAGRSTLRIGTWNLQNFVLEKAKNPGVREVICRTILENGISLIAVQEIASKEAISLLVSELNDPQLQNVKNWDGPRGKWHWLVSRTEIDVQESFFPKAFMNGFLYDTSKGLKLKDSTVFHISTDKVEGLPTFSQPFIGWFKVGTISFVIVTLNLFSEICVPQFLPSIVDLLKEKLSGEKNIFLMGNFILPPGHTVFEMLTSQGYTHLLPSSASTNLETKQENTHLWSSSRNILTGHNKIVTEGLSHIVIPKGWEWGGPASDHCPVWAEIYTHENGANNIPISNGVCKCLEVPGGNFHLPNNSLMSEYTKKEKGMWGTNWVWKYTQKNGVSCEKDDSLKENGTV